MRRLLSVLIAVGLLVVAPGAGHADVGADAVCYGSFRVVRAAPGAPGTPQITLPAGWTPVSGSQFQVASRAEFYSFIQGPACGPVQVTLRWPGVPVRAVVSGDSRLAVTPDPGDPAAVRFTVPASGASTGAVRPTLEVFSYPSGSTASGLYWRIEHNDPDRVAGVWTTVPWPAAPAVTFLNHQVAVAEILRDSGLLAEAQRRGHFYVLMGFETNNTLHADNPPHWHLSYYPGADFGAPRAHVPHFWMDAAGRMFFNGMDVQGQGRTSYRAGDPARIHDAAGNLIVTLTIRADGGLDIDPPAGPRYSIITSTSFAHEVRVLRAGQPWLWVRVTDDVKTGIMTAQSGGLDPADAFRQTTITSYDPLTGPIRSVTTKRVSG